MMSFKDKCFQIRQDILELFISGGRGHLPSAYSLVEILVTLYYQHCNISPENINDPARDRILLSKGHGCMALYAILCDKGFFPREEFQNFCKTGGILGGHPTRGQIPGVEISAGSLGHGPSIASGQALSLKTRNILSRLFVVIGDGECNEGSIWEAALSANKNKLDNLTILIDYNKLQSFGPNEEVCPLEPFALKWRSFNFETFEVDMKNEPEKLLEILRLPQTSPRAIICHTIKGQGHPLLENNLNWHHKNKLSKEDIEVLKAGLSL